jgi:hypothetical protein
VVEQAGDGELIVVELAPHALNLILHLLQSPQLSSYGLFQPLTLCTVIISIESLHFQQTLSYFLAEHHPPHLLVLSQHLLHFLLRVGVIVHEDDRSALVQAVF